MSMGIALFQLKFTGKQLRKQYGRALTRQTAEEKNVKKALERIPPNLSVARIHATNATRIGQESENLLRLASRVDAAASRIQTASTMRDVTKNMGTVVRALSQLGKVMDVSNVAAVMDQFEKQSEDLDVSTAYYEDAISAVTATDAPQQTVDSLMKRMADEIGVQIQLDDPGLTVPYDAQSEANLSADPATTTIPAVTLQAQDDLGARLRALRQGYMEEPTPAV